MLQKQQRIGELRSVPQGKGRLEVSKYKTRESIRQGERKCAGGDRQGEQGELLRWKNTREFGRPEDWKKKARLRFEYTRYKEI